MSVSTTGSGAQVPSADARARLRFDFADTLGLPAPVCFEEPSRTIVARTVAEVLTALRAVEEAARDGWYAAGFVAYEAAPAFDSALVTREAADVAVPLVWFGLFRAPCECQSRSELAATATATATTAGVAAAATAKVMPMSAASSLTWTADVTREAYHDRIEAVKAAIARGDTYQVNYTFRLRAEAAARGAYSRDALDRLYAELVRAHRAPYAASLDLGRWRILSLSPELFMRVDGRRITTRPMKGTAARGRWPEEDDAQAAWLAASEKNRAENVMIVDLARNDVGRVATIGSVRASALFDVERYPSVFQMVSTVDGTLRPEATLTDVFAALFPAGSITGAPKSSSMRLIAGIESAPRGVYCGAIGFVTPSGDAIFNVAIRTAVFDGETGGAEYGVGGGITWDSTADAEYAEALSKAGALSAPPAFELLETMRMEEGRYVRRARHLARLREAAIYFDVPCRIEEVEAALDAHAAAALPGMHRIRLLVSATDGAVRIEDTLLTAPFDRGPFDPGPFDREPADREPADRARFDRERFDRRAFDQRREPGAMDTPFVALARTPVSRADRFLYHKTTNRGVYESRRAERPDAFDVLLWNEANQVTEFTIGNVVVEIDGQLWTPPRHCGLLAGTLRAELIEAGAIRERIVTVDEIASVTRLWMINSVRGSVALRLTPPPRSC